ncbi:hypothetical protein DSD19_16695 [Rhodovulum sp. BSW8]|uniref:hypothetical protein n=1 Tax=Rhodovulum sp. BSW8 TaxID=2259645 RepID=UPI000DE5594F|nr:hypothetical protein [Rhodovulum sp. BSW8]RBO52132.1 hypothetical protein DSD19_16695 [Rhodovulum sp. BSW8]
MRAPLPLCRPLSGRPALALAAALVVWPVLALPVPAGAQTQVQSQAQRQCGPREGILSQLRDRYGESRQAIGLAANNAVVEVFANTQTGTWTVTGTFANGLTCLIASGGSFETLDEPSGQGL